jgi:hypothetical protein
MPGDRGVIKAKGKAALSARGFSYITALTNACLRQAFGTTENTKARKATV